MIFLNYKHYRLLWVHRVIQIVVAQRLIAKTLLIHPLHGMLTVPGKWFPINAGFIKTKIEKLFTKLFRNRYDLTDDLLYLNVFSIILFLINYIWTKLVFNNYNLVTSCMNLK